MGIVDKRVERQRDENVDKRNPQISFRKPALSGCTFPQEFLCIYSDLSYLLGFPRPYDNDDLFKYI